MKFQIITGFKKSFDFFFRKDIWYKSIFFEFNLLWNK